jgi:hypothetical protein
MPPERARPTGGYLLGLLADGAAAFAPRTGVHRLLGVPAAEAQGVSFLPPLPPVGFQYAAWGGGAAPGPGAPGGLAAPLGPPAPRAELAPPPLSTHAPGRPASSFDAWDGGNDAARPAPSASAASSAPPRMDTRTAFPAASPDAVERGMQARETRGAGDPHPGSHPSPFDSASDVPRSPGALAAPRGRSALDAARTAPVDATSPAAAKPAADRPADERPADGVAEARGPARTVGLTIPGVSGAREILAALAQRQASRETARPDPPRAPADRSSGAADAEGQGTGADAAHPTPRRPFAAPLLPPRRAEVGAAGEGRGEEMEAHAEAAHPMPRRASTALARPATDVGPQLQGAGRGGEAEVEQLRRATAARARQSAPPRDEPAPPAPPTVIVQAAPAPPVVVQAAAGPEAYAPRAFLASSLLRGSHLRVLR